MATSLLIHLHIIQPGDTIESIAAQYGIKDPQKLYNYHNQHCDKKNFVYFSVLKPGKEFLIPPLREIAQWNTVTEVSRERQQQQIELLLKEKEKNQRLQQLKEQNQKSHADKYYVVHGATCGCDKAENPLQTATIKVTSHKTVVFNDQKDKFLATEADTMLSPATATFGKCTLKPSSSGYMPCVFAPAKKWDDTYQKTKVDELTALTEISKLRCAAGGTISIKHHGQTHTVALEHSLNTSALALSMASGMKMPVLGILYPWVKQITVTHIHGRDSFTPVASDTEKKQVPKVVVRLHEQLTFEAKITRGNMELTSWILYSAPEDQEYLRKEQIGTQFQTAFTAVGTYRVEAYGHPKDPEYQDGKYNCNNPEVSIDVEVVQNTLQDIQPATNTPLIKYHTAAFKALFILEPTTEELQNLVIYAQDAKGNCIQGTQQGSRFVFKPLNAATQYTIIAEYKDSQGNCLKQLQCVQKSVNNTVTSIKKSMEDQILRPGTALDFSVASMKYDVADIDLTDAFQEVKWRFFSEKNPQGSIIGNGKSVHLPGSMLLQTGRYVIESYVVKSNGWFKKKTKERDEWEFHIQNNDVLDFVCSGPTRVGKTITLKADRFIINGKPLPNEKIYWTINGKRHPVSTKEIRLSLTKPGTLIVHCCINQQKGIQRSFIVKMPVIHDVVFSDNNALKLQKASWGQTINIAIDQQDLIGEDLAIFIHEKKWFGTHEIAEQLIKKYDGALIAFPLSQSIKNKAQNNTSFYLTIKPQNIIATGEDLKYPKKYLLEVNDTPEIYHVQIGDENGQQRHQIVDYDKISWGYIRTTYPEKTTLKIELYHAQSFSTLVKLFYASIFDAKAYADLRKQYDPKLSYAATVGADGVAKVKIDWGALPEAKQKKKDPMTFGIVVCNKKDNIYYKIHHAVILSPVSDLVKIPGNNSPVKVAKMPEKAHSPNQNCPNCNEPVTAAQLKAIFTKADIASLKKTADAYTKYMERFQMNTCWNKAHFFAQAVVESGTALRLKKGESMNYLVADLPKIFAAFRVNPKKDYDPVSNGPNALAQKYGRIEKKNDRGKTVITQSANQEKIANTAYGPDTATGKQLENTKPDDGHRFRGRGLIQITGRNAYTYANPYTLKENADIVENPDRVATDITVAVIASMVFFQWKKINTFANGKTQTKEISREVGLQVRDSYTLKQKVFEQTTATCFETSHCQWREETITNSELKIAAGIAWLENLQISQQQVNDGVPYKVGYDQDTNRTHPSGEDTMDCSEMVCRYLQKIEWSKEVPAMETKE